MEYVAHPAKEHRAYIAGKFGGRHAGTPGEDGTPTELTVSQIMGDPNMAKLGIEVAIKLQEQFAEFDGNKEGESKDVTRRKLEALANTLEVLLEETLNELELLDG